MDFTGLKFLVVGAGLWGSVIAERVASVLGEDVLVIEKNPCSGGMCRSFVDSETGVECHAHGTHIFHTKLPHVWEYVTRFSAFTHYRHKVLTTHAGRVYPMPIGLATINAFYGTNLKPSEVAEFIASEAGSAGEPSKLGEPSELGEPRNLEEKAISLVGRRLYEAFIKGYTAKQWGVDPRELPASIITRLPVRANYDTDYYSDPWDMQGLPASGYGGLFDRLLSHPRIHTAFGTDFMDVRHLVPPDCEVFYGGPVDRLFGFSLGRLDWRSLSFEWRVEPCDDWQGTSVMNYADADVPYTRIHEYKHLHPGPDRPHAPGKTVICVEYPKASGASDDGYYPTHRGAALHAEYMTKAEALPRLHVGGRLGSYRYYDMDATVAEALKVFEKVKLARQS
ncbi:MAG: NAD(P)-binding protein [Synergistaceae bacterium]|jgi:UDP-galactopyranose mutase|nr:NAD(P)-binding protein [Synergistaceae bacterium]